MSTVIVPDHVERVRWKLQRWANRVAGRYGVPIYLVGSALRVDNPDPRDWDVRITLPDEQFALAFGPVEDWEYEGGSGAWTRTRWRWSAQCVKDTHDFNAWCHLNGDVQLYPASHVERVYADKPRLRIDSAPPATWFPERYTQVPSGCWVACIAGLTGLPHDELAALVPTEDQPQGKSDLWTAYHNAVNRYTRARGWRYSPMGPDIPHGFAIGVGESPRGLRHAILVRDGELWWDPHPSRAGLVTLDSFEIWTPIRGQLPGREVARA